MLLLSWRVILTKSLTGWNWIHSRITSVSSHMHQNIWHDISMLFAEVYHYYMYVVLFHCAEKRIKSMKCKHVDLPLSDDPAAGFRK